MSSAIGLTQAIYDLLERADDSLTCREINDQLTELSVVTGGSGRIAARLRQAELAGRFVRSEIAGQLRWTNNPEWGKPSSRKRKATTWNAVKPKSVPKEATPAAVPAPTPVVEAAAPPQPIHPVEAAPAKPLNEVEAVPARQARPPHNLIERLDAISDDLRDALLDACSAELPHRLIGRLVEANSATQAAARQLAGV